MNDRSWFQLHVQVLINKDENGAVFQMTGESVLKGETCAFKPSTSPAAVNLKDICLSFGGVCALSGINLSVSRGEIRAIIGPNGAGKSSLINVISGLYTPSAGQIYIDGVLMRRVPARRISQLGIARTFQNLALFAGLSVRDNLVSGLVHCRRTTFIEQIAALPRARREDAEIDAKVEAMAAFIGLESEVNKTVSSLPYGFQKRVDLGRALISKPKILMLDEPMAGLGATDKKELTALIRASRDQYDPCILLVEHDIGVVMGLSDRIAVLDHGTKISDGTPTEVSADPDVIRAYIGADNEEEAISV